MFIISFAVVGAATLQIESLKNSLAMEHRAQATFLANDLLERIRATKHIANGMSRYEMQMPANPSQDCPINNSNDVIEADVTEWRCLVTSTLPSGRPGVTVDPNTGFVSINFQWVQRPVFIMGAPQNMSFVIQAKI